MRLAVSLFAMGCLLLSGQAWTGQARAQADADPYAAPPPAAAPAAPGQPPAAKPKPKPKPKPAAVPNAGAPGAAPAAAPAADPAAAPGAAPVAAPPKPKPVAPPAKLLDKHADWTSYVHETRGAKVCFAAATPKDMLPKAVKRTNVYFYLTTWQKDGVRDEASLTVGYQLKPDTPVKVMVDSSEFTFFARADKAYIRDPAEERKLLQAMSSGQTLTVQAVSAKGTQTTDQYSLAGLDAAVKKIGEVCP
jgi:invasion protein IalB